MEHTIIYFAMACTFGLFMAWGIGANDVANAMGTSVGSKAFTLKQALIAAAIFETLGAMLAGGSVTTTIRSGIIDPTLFAADPNILVWGMLASLLAAGTWLITASYFGWPVSTTHSIVGAIVGFAVAVLGVHSVEWGQMTSIFSSWILTPIVAGVGSYLLFLSVQKLILNTQDPFRNAKRYVPFYIFLVAMIISMVTLVKGLKHLSLNITYADSFIIAIFISFLFMLLGMFIMKGIKVSPSKSVRAQFVDVEKVFAVLMMFTACSMAFAHGSNDVANAIGPLAAVIQVIQANGHIASHSTVPLWVLGIGAAGIVIGLAMYGYKVIRTIGTHITELTPSRGFAAELSTAGTVVIASGLGLPVSTTQTLVGAVLGIGIARGIAAINLNIVRNIFLSWVITLPVGAILAIFYYYILKALFS